MDHETSAARVLRAARSWLGTPYHHQASIKGVGCDCLGLIRGVWREVEGQEPEPTPGYSSAWSEVSGQEQLLEAAQRNFIQVEIDERQVSDLLIFRLRARSAAKHVGILSAAESFIHAYDGAEVFESALNNFWQSRLVAVFRFPCVTIEGK